MGTNQEKWECPNLIIQQFTPQEYIAVCFDFCCDAESYSITNQGGNIVGGPYLEQVVWDATTSQWVSTTIYNQNGDFREISTGAIHLGTQGAVPGAACHGSIAVERWGHWRGTTGTDCLGGGVSNMTLWIGSGTGYTPIPVSSAGNFMGSGHACSYNTVVAGVTATHFGHTTTLTNAS